MDREVRCAFYSAGRKIRMLLPERISYSVGCTADSDMGKLGTVFWACAHMALAPLLCPLYKALPCLLTASSSDIRDIFKQAGFKRIHLTFLELRNVFYCVWLSCLLYTLHSLCMIQHINFYIDLHKVHIHVNSQWNCHNRSSNSVTKSCTWYTDFRRGLLA